MERAGRFLSKLKISDKIPAEELACAAWPVCVGEQIATHARAVALVRGNLVVEVDDAIWQKQLFYLKSHILRKMHTVIAETMVTDVEFRIAIATPRRPPQMAMASRASADPSLSPNDEADSIADAGLRIVYKRARKKAMG